MICRSLLSVSGVVQGVGFRPFVHRLATDFGLDGVVSNDSSGVTIDVQGPAVAVDAFVLRVVSDAPPLAIIESIQRCDQPVVDRAGFSIDSSRSEPTSRPTLVSPDVATCDDCLNELFDPADRRHGHPFINCTNCGPRFTIIQALPYDRPATTMADFALCDRCRREYDDPTDRRFHAQPIACHDCGPRLWLTTDDGERVAGPANRLIDRTIELLADGAVVAVKGIGGYHLVCDALDDAAVALLRARKHRPDKPFAVMVRDLDCAHRLAEISPTEADILTSATRPVTLLVARSTGTAVDGRGEPLSVSPAVAPNNPMIGMMLPYTPIHHLLLADDRIDVLVMTSGNLAGEPIAHEDDDAAARLGPLVDAILGHDRPIHLPCDDSVVRLVEGRMLPIRRARGVAPMPITLDLSGPSVLAVGGELKSTFAIGRRLAGSGPEDPDRTRLWVSQHIGDMENLATQQAFESGVEQFCGLYGVDPDVVVVDAHPGYRSSRWARARYGNRVVEVQHHEAHIAAVVADNHHPIDRPVIGFAFDGTGYGLDGTIWGGEVFAGPVAELERVAHLAPIPLPGGDQAIRYPVRAALAHLWQAGIDWADVPDERDQFTAGEQQLLLRQLERSIACVPTTSMGRLFDAVASLLGLRHSVSFEAQAAIDLEHLARRSTTPRQYRFWTQRPTAVGVQEPAPIVFDAGPVLRAIVDDHRVGIDSAGIALGMHHAVAEVMVSVAIDVRRERGIETAAMSGGVFQNALLVELARRRLEDAGFAVLTHRTFPANDGGLALGQAVLALARHRRRVAAAVTQPTTECSQEN